MKHILVLAVVLILGTVTPGFTETRIAPELALQDLQGNAAQLSSLRGKVVVLNFWATWCAPCRKEMPLFVQLQNEYASRGVQFVAASTDTADAAEEVRKFARDFRLNFPVWINATAEQQQEFGLGTSLPATAIIDGEGKICFRIIGESKRNDLVSRLEYLLSTPGREVPPELVVPEGMTAEHFTQHHEHAGEEDHHEHGSEEAGSEVPS